MLVVGGGFTGLSAALNLAERGFDVVLLEARRIGWGASGRNGGQIAGGFNRSVAEIARLAGPDDARRLWQMSEEAKTILRDRVARHAIDCDLRWGSLLAALKRRHVAELQEYQSEMAALGYPLARMIDRAGVRRLVDCPHYVGGLLDSGSGQIHPLNYALGLARAAAAAGVRLHEETTVERLDGDGAADAPVTAHTTRGTVLARHVVLAGNAYLHGLSAEIRRTVRPRVMPAATYMIATEPLDEARAAAVLPGDMAVADINFVLNYYRMSADRRMLFGGGVSYSTVTRPDLAQALSRRMAYYLPALAGARIDYAWGGNVAITLNRLPHFGRAGRNVFFAQGFSGHGVSLAGLAGALMAEAVAGTAERFDVFARIPHRAFPGGRLLRMPALVLAMAWYRLRDML